MTKPLPLLYDHISTTKGIEGQIIRCYEDSTFLFFPFEGHPSTITNSDVDTILDSVFTTITSLPTKENFKRILLEAEQRWEEYNSKTKTKTTRKKKDDLSDVLLDITAF